MNTIVVTGAAGYIGGQCALLLKDAGYHVLGVDLLPLPGHLSAVMDFVQADFDSDEFRNRLLAVRPRAIIHCAGTSLVGPSMTNPRLYYNNNVVKTLNLVETILAALPGTRLIFSSSAAVYGNPVMTPCQEIDPCNPISPYGESKFMVEQILNSYHRAYGLDYVAFRYFNACGADSQARHGQAPGATHIVARALESVINNNEFELYGTDFDTRDGTCVRDYVHVEDIARAHVTALDSQVPAGVYNLGSHKGTSNLEVLAACHIVTGIPVTTKYCARRNGDPDTLTASDDKFVAAAGQWRQYDLLDMIKHAWSWYNKR